MIEQYDSNNNYLGKTDFILDNMSNLINVNIYNWQNVNGVMTNQLIQTSSAQYDAKNRLYKTIVAYNQTNQLTYDNNNNITQLQDPANYLTNSNYDQLNRLTQITQADSCIVQFNYTPDNLTASVKDPKNLETIYTYDGFGRLIQLNSPDTGISTMTYDIGDNILNGLMPSLNQSFVDFFAGYGDSASFGLTYLIRNLGDFNEVNMCSSAYYIGEASEVIVNLASYGTSLYLRSLIRKINKKDVKKNINANVLYKSMKTIGSEVHHINPLFGHKSLKGMKSKLEATFPTGGLNIKIHTSKWNLKLLTKTEHNKEHARAIILENNYEVYHNLITTGIKIETNILNR